MNRHDSAVLEGALVSGGLVPVEDPEHADVVIFNTCTVRQHAEDRLFSNVGHLRQLKRRRPDLVVGVVGCVAQKEGRAIVERFPHVSFVVGTQALERVPEIIEEGVFPRVETDLTGSPHPLPFPSSEARLVSPWSAYVAAMRGCDNFCSYCVVPYVRGREVSRPPEDIERDVRALAGRGVSEITLLGQNIDSYGKGLSPRVELADLLCRVSAADGLWRLRFVTSHPRDMSRRLVEAVRDIDVVCEYFHVPAQAGSDRVLEAMSRGYSRERYLELVGMIRELVPVAGVVSDFIVGFPGETRGDFEQTAALVEQARFRSAFIFKYSPRPGTKAAGLPDDVPPEEKARRHAELSALQKRISLEENERAVGREHEVLVEGASPRDAERLTGRTRDFRIVIMPAGAGSPGDYVTVRISAATALALYAEGASPAGGEMPGGS
jgi:tRNA-2-methylthio-N6-dimethylallyladenosine synthase